MISYDSILSTSQDHCEIVNASEFSHVEHSKIVLWLDCDCTADSHPQTVPFILAVFWSNSPSFPIRDPSHVPRGHGCLPGLPRLWTGGGWQINPQGPNEDEHERALAVQLQALSVRKPAACQRCSLSLSKAWPKHPGCGIPAERNQGRISNFREGQPVRSVPRRLPRDHDLGRGSPSSSDYDQFITFRLSWPPVQHGLPCEGIVVGGISWKTPQRWDDGVLQPSGLRPVALAARLGVELN